MRRSDFYIKLTTAVLFFAVVCYIGVYVYDAFKNTYQTVRAVAYSVEETRPARGYIIREETVLKDASASILPIVSQGEKVAAGQVVAVEYRNNAAMETADEIRALELRLSQLEEAASRDLAGRYTLASESVLDLSKAVHSGSFSELDTISLSVESYVFSAGTSEDELSGLRGQISRLRSQNTGARAILAPVSGVFSSEVDGYESVWLDEMENITPTKLEELFNGSAGRTENAGKLVTGIRWYYAAVMDNTDAARLMPLKSITVQFGGSYRASYEMTIEHVGRNENGSCVILFSADRGISEIAPFRAINAEVVFDTVSGIRVPKEAIHLDDGGASVYLQTGVIAEQVAVEILCELGDAYLVKNRSETGAALRPGALIIVKANNLYDGKVVL